VTPLSLTTEARLGVGSVERHGAATPYRRVVEIEGERHVVRDDLMPPAESPDGTTTRGRPLACLVHVTDLQLADVQSPARFEFLNRYFADPRYVGLLPTQRPQEALTPHAVHATLRTINGLTGPVTGLPPQLIVTTGDAIDNAQWNELQALLALFDGGRVVFGPPGGYHGVQATNWPDDIFWRPDGDGRNVDGAVGPDIFRREFGFPHHPGLLELAVREFRSSGLNPPWLSCFGNHEALIQGVGVPGPNVAAVLTGGVKPTAQADGFDHDRALELFTERPEAFAAGPALPVPPSPDRRPVSRSEFVRAHFRTGARPDGHGFTDRNRRDGTAYYAYDTPEVRFIALDTACLAGGADGCLDADQARWLEAALAEVHSAYQRPDGELVHTDNADRLVVIFSHHGTSTLSNARHQGGLSAAELTGLLHRFGNVVLWLNGHTHANQVRAWPAPYAPRASGFWEVTTCSVVDWPCQTRLVEIIDAGSELRITCTMVDHQAKSGVRLGGADLAALHRELAANMPFLGVDSGRDGSPADRNVVLRLPSQERRAALLRR
jgi:metallophosphoesterase (TIGR03767 family)